MVNSYRNLMLFVEVSLEHEFLESLYGSRSNNLIKTV